MELPGWVLMRLRACVVLLCVLGNASGGRAQVPADVAVAKTAVDGGVDAAVVAPAETPLAVVPALDPRIGQIAALVAGKLSVAVDPQSLFDVSLENDHAVQVESVRVHALLRMVDESAAPPPRRGARVRQSEAPAATTRADIESLDPVRWEARVALDRARAEFYALTAERRAELLKAHAAARAAELAKESVEARAVREAEEERRRVFEAAEAERAAALAAAQAAHSEAERLVAEEVARLIGVQRAVDDVRESFRVQHTDLVARRDRVLAWQRRLRDLKPNATDEADATYVELRRRLQASRDELSDALDKLTESSTVVPALGDDPLESIASDVPTTDAVARRRRIREAIANATEEEVALREERASTLLYAVDALNRERLGLLGRLSYAKRSAITGFTAAGLDQARSEIRHLFLILRYHRHEGSRTVAAWLASWSRSTGFSVSAVWRGATSMAPWLLVVVAFIWWRRRSTEVLAAFDAKLADTDRAERRITPSAQRRVLRFVSGVHRPIEWLLLFGAAMALVSTQARALLEVQLATVIVGWTLAGALVVNTINGLAMTSDVTGMGAVTSDGRLRLRSLRLVGRVVVVLTLVLVLSSRLVGEGTVYRWVWSTCWLAAFPVFLLLVRWWRSTIFDRVQRIRRPSPLQAWMLANRAGYKSFLAAMIAAVQLFTLGAWRAVRNWISDFDIARHAHAYFFKREIDRLAGSRPTTMAPPAAVDTLDSLAPGRAGDTWVACAADEQIAHLTSRVAEGRGGVVLLVGGYGLGKSCMLRRLESRHAGALLLTCDANTTADSIASALAARPTAPSMVLLDDTQMFVKPVLDGVRRFDAVLALARSRSPSTLWVFAMESIVWPFLRRARDARPLFDEVIELEAWTDDEIGDLLSQRCREAKIDPTFEDLIELPPTADEIDRQEALAAKRVGYFRMVWDYARGNPAIALEVWRSSLSSGSDGSIRVRPLHVPDASCLQSLPDATLFILRAVMQMTPASVVEVSEATRLSEAHIQNALTYGQAQGYLHVEDGRIRVTWAWLRAITLFLERRHLLVGS